jgi:ABC-type multidrug transport system ATPase subunit
MRFVYLQFDEQSPGLTILETVEFSAKLRLEETDPAVNPESTEKFIRQTLDMLELTPIEHLQVGSDLTGGLSFEQKKRLSIAVECVSNPSILFLVRTGLLCWIHFLSSSLFGLLCMLFILCANIG